MDSVAGISKTDVTPAILSRDFDARERDSDARQSHRIKQRSIPKTSRAIVRRAMMQRATRPVTLATLTRDPCRASKSLDFVEGVTSVLLYQQMLDAIKRVVDDIFFWCIFHSTTNTV